jgi:hypothetical protein
MATTVPCPSCSHLVAVPDDESAGTITCTACGVAFEMDDRPWERPEEGHVRRDWEPHRASTVLTLGTLSVALFPLCGASLLLGIPTWVMGQSDLRKMREKTMDPAGEMTTRAGWVLGIVGSALGTLALLGCLGYIGFAATMVTMMRPMAAPPKTVPAVKKAGPPAPPAPVRPVPEVKQ